MNKPTPSKSEPSDALRAHVREVLAEAAGQRGSGAALDRQVGVRYCERPLPSQGMASVRAEGEFRAELTRDRALSEGNRNEERAG
jgi:hypothetical protein